MVAGDRAAVIGVFRGASEAERRALASVLPETSSRAKAALWSLLPGLSDEEQTRRPHVFHACKCIALLASASWSEIRKRGTDGLPWESDLARVLLDRRPAWLGSLVKWLASPRQLGQHWSSLRILEREGLVEVPRTHLYWTCMADVFTTPWRLIANADRDDHPTLADVLRLDRTLLERDIWDMLEVERAVETISQHAKWYPNTDPAFDAMLVELANEGLVPRFKVLEAALEGLTRSTPKTVAWFLGLLGRIAPSLEEQSRARDAYLHLLSARMGAAVDVGLRDLGSLRAAGRLEPGVLEPHIGPLLASKSKAQALKGLRLLEQALESEPAAATGIAEASMEGFSHPSPDVHAATLKLLEHLAPEALAPHAGRMAESLDLIAPSLRARLEALVRRMPGGEARSAPRAAPAHNLGALEQQARALDPAIAARAGIAAALEFARAESALLSEVPIDDGLAPRLDASDALSPIAGLDDLVDVLLRGLEGGIRGDEAELALDGMARMPADRQSSDFAERTQALRQRAEQVIASQGQPFVGQQVTSDLAGLALAWAAGRAPDERYYREDLFFQQRLRKLARRLAAGRRLRLLSTPTHKGGWIHPRALPGRWLEARRNGDEPDLEDQIQALLRLAPDSREAAIRETLEVAGEFGDALRFALGCNGGAPACYPLWSAAAKARRPRGPEETRPVEVVSRSWGARARFEIHVRHARRTQVSTVLASFGVALGPAVRGEPHLAVETEDMWREPSRMAASWWASAWPACPEGFFAQEIGHLKWSLDQTAVRWSGDWEPLFDPEVPATPVARALVLLGLSARHPGISGLARDALVAMIFDGRLTERGLAESLALVLPTDVLTHPRWLSAFREVAGVSPLHLWVLREALAGSVVALRAKPAAPACAVLEVLHEWSVEVERAVPDPARVHLQSMTGGKLGRLAKSILGIAENPGSGVRREAALVALAGRIERARRYEARLGP